ncbi:expressed unknown protein [Seminavis robusta]|uniref:Uncharacterized protein n=1 Tax=Seminavis robusta TaxID=568900 RepID=A0A9N8DBU5_9STRA|nr:expressed unknown protein [Seminavis robusta]|eukprot:Sro81_g043391.1  (109) ;mRNA; r:30391-30717
MSQRENRRAMIQQQNEASVGEGSSTDGGICLFVGQNTCFLIASATSSSPETYGIALGLMIEKGPVLACSHLWLRLQLLKTDCCESSTSASIVLQESAGQVPVPRTVPV